MSIGLRLISIGDGFQNLIRFSIHLMWRFRKGRLLFGLLIAAASLTAIATIASADDSKNQAITKDRKQIEGTWRFVGLEVDGNKATEEDVKKLTVVNGSDGTWSLRSEDKEISKGTSTIDPTKKSPRPLTSRRPTGEEKGDQYLGICELGENTRRLCFGPAERERPTDFSSTPGSQRILVTFERQKAK